MAVVAVPTPFFSKLVNIYVKRRLFSFLTYVLRLQPSLKITDYVKVAIPPPLYLSNFMFIKDNTFCVSIGLDYVKDRWAFQKEDGSEHKEVVTMCCAIKPITSWLLEETVSITRLEFLCFFLTIFLLLFMKNQPSSFL